MAILEGECRGNFSRSSFPKKEDTIIRYSDLLRSAQEILPWMIEIRRDLHEHPEMDFELHRTAEKVEERLRELGISSKRYAKTGMAATLEGDAAGPCVLLRADMDALPIQDTKEVPYKSKIPGVMHACGHDAHTAILLGALRLLRELPEPRRGTLLGIFQPAEESAGGALPMIREGALREHPPRYCLGLHVTPSLPAGTVGYLPGKLHTASEMFDVTIHGKGGHGASPEEGIDAIAVGASFVGAIQQIVSRRTNPLDSAVVSIGRFVGEGARNVISSKVELSGIIRTLEPSGRERVKRQLSEAVYHCCAALGARGEVRFTEGYPCLVNDAEITRRGVAAGEKILAEGAMRLLPQPNMGVDDFAYFLQEAPGSYFKLGTAREGEEDRFPLHTSNFDIDEKSLAYGAAFLAGCSLDLWNTDNS